MYVCLLPPVSTLRLYTSIIMLAFLLDNQLCVYFVNSLLDVSHNVQMWIIHLGTEPYLAICDLKLFQEINLEGF
jgi:hypothetical protein